MLSAAGSLHHLLTPWPAVCHGARAATRTNTRRASRSGAHIRACSSAGRVLAERCLGISRLVVLVCVRQQLMWVERPYRCTGCTWRRERSRADPQRRGRGSTKKDRDMSYGKRETALHLSQSTHHSHRGVWCVRCEKLV